MLRAIYLTAFAAIMLQGAQTADAKVLSTFSVLPDGTYSTLAQRGLPYDRIFRSDSRGNFLVMSEGMDNAIGFNTVDTASYATLTPFNSDTPPLTTSDIVGMAWDVSGSFPSDSEVFVTALTDDGASTFAVFPDGTYSTPEQAGWLFDRIVRSDSRGNFLVMSDDLDNAIGFNTVVIDSYVTLTPLNSDTPTLATTDIVGMAWDVSGSFPSDSEVFVTALTDEGASTFAVFPDGTYSTPEQAGWLFDRIVRSDSRGNFLVMSDDLDNAVGFNTVVIDSYATLTPFNSDTPPFTTSDIVGMAWDLSSSEVFVTAFIPEPATSIALLVGLAMISTRSQRFKHHAAAQSP